MAFQIPDQNKKFIQSNKSDIFGNLFSTWNMDFDTVLGKVRVAPRTRINTDETDDAQLGLPTAFVRSSADSTDRWWALCGTVLFKTAGTNPTATFTQDAISNTPTNATLVSSDMTEFNGKLYVSLSADIAEMESGTWTASWWDGAPLNQSALTSSIAHPIHVTKKTNTFLVGDGNLVHAVDTNENVTASRLIFPTEFEVIWIRSTYNGTWIGARNKSSAEAMAFFWDESAENYNRGYKLKHNMTFACVIDENELPNVVNGAGQLLRFDGIRFKEMAVFPNFKQVDRELNDGNTVIRSINRNGMAIIEGKIHTLVSSQINNTFGELMENFPSGIWTFDESQGLRHRYALSQYDGTEIDYGSFLFSQVGALVSTNIQDGLFLAGGDIFTDTSTDINAIFFRDPQDSIVKRGHFTTSIFESSAFEDIFQDLLVTFKRFRSSSDRILIKYRTIKDPNFPIVSSSQGTWTDTDTFTTTTNLSNVSAGDEISIIRGRGAGTLLTIDTITFSSPTYTVNLTETTPNVSGTIHFIADNWTLAATVSAQSIDRQEFDLDALGTFIQLKVELRSASGSAGAGDSPELEKIIIRNKSNEVI